MTDLGIFTGLDLRAQSLEFLRERFGKAGTHYYWIVRAVDDRPVQPDRVRKSVGAENTFSQDLSSIEEMRAALEPIIEKVWKHCEKTGVRGRTVTLKMKFSDFRQITRSRTLAFNVDGQDELRQASFDLLHAVFPIEKSVRLLGVSLSTLNADTDQREDSPQLSLQL